MPKVSVIIPVYGVERYIERCARSLFEQTINEIEYLFIDDCSPDKSVEILRLILEQYPNRKEQVIIHKMNRNSGQAAVREWGMKHATGEYVIHCDSDDWVDADLYENMYTVAKKKNIDVVICDIMLTSGCGGKKMYGGYTLDVKECVDKLFHQKMSWSLCNKLFKTELTKTIAYPKDAMGEDMCITLQIMQKALSVGYVSGCYWYYINPQSIVNLHEKEKLLMKYKQLCRNIDIVIKAYSVSNRIEYKRGFCYLQFFKNDFLVPLTGQKEYYSMWRNGIRQWVMPVLFDNSAKFKERVKAFMILTHLYPFCFRIIKIIRR